jgi:hypothetical protein
VRDFLTFRDLRQADSRSDDAESNSLWSPRLRYLISIDVCESYLANHRVGNKVGSNPRSGYQALTVLLHFCNLKALCNV